MLPTMRLTTFLALALASLIPAALAAVPHPRWGLEKKQSTGKLVFAHFIVSTFRIIRSYSDDVIIGGLIVGRNCWQQKERG